MPNDSARICIPSIRAQFSVTRDYRRHWSLHEWLDKSLTCHKQAIDLSRTSHWTQVCRDSTSLVTRSTTSPDFTIAIGYICIDLRLSTWLYMCFYLYICIYVYIYVYVYVCIYINVIYIHTTIVNIGRPSDMYIYIFICMYAYTHM